MALDNVFHKIKCKEYYCMQYLHSNKALLIFALQAGVCQRDFLLSVTPLSWAVVLSCTGLSFSSVEDSVQDPTVHVCISLMATNTQWPHFLSLTRGLQ